MTKETGIIMSGNHPELILEKLKMMTRRMAGLNEINKNPDDWILDDTLFIHKGKLTACFLPKDRDPSKAVFVSCPYGQVGDRLWVRETYALEPVFDAVRTNHVYAVLKPKKPVIYYAADHAIHQNQGFTVSTIQDYGGGSIGRLRPSIFMPRWASRILLEITGLRAERVQEISERDAMAEGVAAHPELNTDGWRTTIDDFKDLWDSLNAKRGYGWDFNPWNWPVTFKVVK